MVLAVDSRKLGKEREEMSSYENPDGQLPLLPFHQTFRWCERSAISTSVQCNCHRSSANTVTFTLNFQPEKISRTDQIVDCCLVCISVVFAMQTNGVCCDVL